MARIMGGAAIRLLGTTAGKGTAGCLLRAPGLPERLLMLTSGHVLVGQATQQFAPVEAVAAPGKTIGVLLSWTGLAGEITTDAALIWVDPEQVDPAVGALGVPKGINREPAVGDRLRCLSLGGASTGVIRALDATRIVTLDSPDSTAAVTFTGQILCDSLSGPGSSGAVVLDDADQVVGMVVAGDSVTFSLVTPIAAIIGHPDFIIGAELALATGIPPEAKAPPLGLSRPPPPPLGTVSDNAPKQEKAQAALAFFLGKGWTRPQVLGIIANIDAESGFRFHPPPGDNGTAFGLCQWRLDRVELFTSRFGHHLQKSTFEEQLAFIHFELTEGGKLERAAGTALKAATTARAAAEIFCRKYERPRDPDEESRRRADAAEAWDLRLA